MKLLVKYLNKDVAPLASKKGDSGYDLRASIDKDIDIPPHDRITVPTGIAIELKGFPTESFSYDLQVRPRSGLTKNGVIAQLGTIDYSYRGEIYITLLNVSDNVFTLEPLARIAQLVITPIFKPTIVEVDELGVTERGCKGFGSTGLK